MSTSLLDGLQTSQRSVRSFARFLELHLMCPRVPMLLWSLPDEMLGNTRVVRDGTACNHDPSDESRVVAAVPAFPKCCLCMQVRFHHRARERGLVTKQILRHRFLRSRPPTINLKPKPQNPKLAAPSPKR